MLKKLHFLRPPINHFPHPDDLLLIRAASVAFTVAEKAAAAAEAVAEAASALPPSQLQQLNSNEANGKTVAYSRTWML